MPGGKIHAFIVGYCPTSSRITQVAETAGIRAYPRRHQWIADANNDSDRGAVLSKMSRPQFARLLATGKNYQSDKTTVASLSH